MTDVLIVDDEPWQARQAAEAARALGFSVLTAHSGAEALTLLREHRALTAVLLDLVMPDLDGMGVMDAMLRENLCTPVIVQTGNPNGEAVRAALRRGAIDFVTKPASAERLLAALASARRVSALENMLRSERARHTGTLTPADFVADSPDMARVMSLAAKAARNPLPVLLEGEAGVGKDTVARLVHGLSERSGRVFVSFDCSATNQADLEATLFGQRTTGRTVAGAFNSANGGTLYLDNVGELPFALQAKLLAALQDSAVTPLGSTRPEPVQVRIIASSRTRLLDLVKAGQFREDLFYRLAVMPIYLSPLRERPADFPALLNNAMARSAVDAGRRISSISDEAVALLQSYGWPGNVRQLENTVFRAVCMCETGQLERSDFPHVAAEGSGRPNALALLHRSPATSLPRIDHRAALPRPQPGNQAVPDRFLDTSGKLLAADAVERALIEFAIEHCHGRMSQVARTLNIGRSTLYRKLREYGLDTSLDSDAA